MQKKLLIITPFFYPSTEISANRLEPIIKYLSSNGWEVFVCAQGINKDPDWGQKKVVRVNGPFIKPVDETKSANNNAKPQGNKKISKVNPLKKALKKSARHAYSRLFVSYWSNKAFKEASSLISEYGINKVLVSSPGIETMLTGYKICKKFKDVELISEIRDIMAYNEASDIPAYMNSFYRKVEIKSNRYIKKYIFLTDIIKSNYEKVLNVRNSAVITNGISVVNQDKDNKISNSKMTISHVGFFYGSRHPLYFLEALGEVLLESEYSKYSDKINILFAGKIVQETRIKMEEIISKYKMESIVTIKGSLSHDEALKIEFMSDINLLVTHIQGSEYAIPGKIFEYMGARRPILALTNDTLVKQLVEKHKLGWHVSNKDVGQIKEKIRYIFNNFEEIKDTFVEEGSFKDYLRENLNKRLEEFLLDDKTV